MNKYILLIICILLAVIGLNAQVTVSSQVSSSAADATEVLNTGIVNLTNTTLKFDDSSVGFIEGGVHLTGLAIPKGAIIENAYVEIFPNYYDPNNTEIGIRFYAEIADSPQIWAATSQNITNRLKTNNFAQFYSNDWVISLVGSDYIAASPDLSSVIQEVVNGSDYQSEDPINIIATRVSGGNYSTYFSYDGDPAKAAKLFVTYLIDSQAPESPQLVGSSPSETAIDLSWSTPSDNGTITGYKVYKNGVLETTLSNVLSYQVTGLLPNISYEFTVTALDAAGNESANSNLQTISTLDYTYTIVTRINCGGPAITATDGFINWVSDNVGGATSGTGFTVSSGIVFNASITPYTRGSTVPISLPTGNHDTVFDSQKYIQSPTTSMLYTIPSLSEGQYKVRIYTAEENTSSSGGHNINVQSTGANFVNPFTSFGPRVTGVYEYDVNLSSSGNITIDFTRVNYAWVFGIEILKSVDTIPPTAPTSLSASGATQTTINLTWTSSIDNVGVVGYKIYKNGILETTLGNDLTYQVMGLAAATAYNFTVTAFDAQNNESVLSNTATATTNASSSGGSYWSLNNQDVFYTNGNVGIGTSIPDSKLTVKGSIHSEEVKVDLSVPAPDYVFKSDYNLTSLDKLREYIITHGHLPNIPSAKDMEAQGIKLGIMNMKLLEKIEELTLYLFQQQKFISEQNQIIKEIQNKLKK